MRYIGVLVLSLVQGIGEFLPISSSAHLIIFRDLLGVGREIISKNTALIFDVALHFGTLMAIVIYFFPKLWKLLIDGLRYGPLNKKGRLFWSIILASVPAAIFGLLLDDLIDNFFRKKYLIIALALIIMGIIIYYFDKEAKEKKELDDITYKDALIIGAAQVFALIPGFSRSGTTIAAARSLNVKRVDAANFSFYLSIPVVFGAVLLETIKEAKNNFNILSANLDVFAIGIVGSFIIGILCIHYFLKYIKKNDFKVFMYYRILIGVAIIISLIFKSL